MLVAPLGISYGQVDVALQPSSRAGLAGFLAKVAAYAQRLDAAHELFPVRDSVGNATRISIRICQLRHATERVRVRRRSRLAQEFVRLFIEPDGLLFPSQVAINCGEIAEAEQRFEISRPNTSTRC